MQHAVLFKSNADASAAAVSLATPDADSEVPSFKEGAPSLNGLYGITTEVGAAGAAPGEAYYTFQMSNWGLRETITNTFDARHGVASTNVA